MDWWTDPYWWVQAIVAFGTVSAVVVALFIDPIKRWLWPPKFDIALKSASGELTPVKLHDPTTDKISANVARYYHLSVKNSGSIAHNAAVYLTAIMYKTSGGAWEEKWTGDVPLVWRHAEIYPLWRDIGASAVDADLFELMQLKWLEVRVVVRPNSLPHTTRDDLPANPGRWRTPINMIIKVQVKSADGESNPRLFYVAWDGQWADGATEIMQCLNIRAINDPSEV